MGVSNVLAGNWAVSDYTSASWMISFYEYLFNNKSISQSVQLASLQIREKYKSAYHWNSFSVHGKG